MSEHGGCEKCLNQDEKVLETRIVKTRLHVRRRLECPACGARRTTYEINQKEYSALRVTFASAKTVL